MGTRTGQCDCCGADDVELSFSVAYGIDTWSCAEGCDTDRDKQHAEWAALADDPEAKAIVENWLSGFGEPPLQLSQLQKDWLVLGIAEAIRGERKRIANAVSALDANDLDSMDMRERAVAAILSLPEPSARPAPSPCTGR